MDKMKHDYKHEISALMTTNQARVTEIEKLTITLNVA